MRNAHKPLLLMLALLSTTACDPSKYLAGLAETSGVQASITAPALIAWAYQVDRSTGDPIPMSGKPTVTDPTITLTLEKNSSPVNFTGAQVQYFNPSAGSVTKSGKIVYSAALANPAYPPFFVQLLQKDRSTAPQAVPVTLSGLVTQELLSLTDPSGATASAIPVITADVKLLGTNEFGAKADTTLTIPITVTRTYTEVN